MAEINPKPPVSSEVFKTLDRAYQIVSGRLVSSIQSTGVAEKWELHAS